MPNGWHKVSKASKTSLHGAEKGVYQACLHHKDVSHRKSHPNKPQEGWMQPHKQVALKADKHKPTEGKSMAKPRSRQANMDIKHRSKQAHTCIKEMIQTL